ncbi:MAG: NosD domain-containing protein [Candidatus Hodarchaeales archaeon]
MQATEGITNIFQQLLKFDGEYMKILKRRMLTFLFLLVMVGLTKVNNIPANFLEASDVVNRKSRDYNPEFTIGIDHDGTGGRDTWKKSSMQLAYVNQYIEHDPIIINGNDDFITQKNSGGWNGSGTLVDPIIISGYNITRTAMTLLKISNTDLYFDITQNLLLGAEQNGIYFDNVSNAKITSNIVFNSSQQGIYLKDSSNCLVSGNEVNSNQVGIQLDSSSNNTVASNTVNDSLWNGIYLLGSSNNTLSGNTVNDNIWNGIYFVDSSNNTLAGNTANDNIWKGIYLVGSSNNLLIGNNATANVQYNIGLIGSANNNTLIGNSACRSSQHGIFLSHTCNNNLLSGNVANNNNWGGIYLYTSSNNVMIGNTARNNSYHGIYLTTSSDHNNITMNSFSENNLGQAYDNGTSNYFAHNYWYDHLSPDVDDDGYFDLPYVIEGLSNNSDYYPLVPAGFTIDNQPFMPLIQLINPYNGTEINNSTVIDLLVSTDYGSLDSVVFNWDGAENSSLALFGSRKSPCVNRRNR